LDAPFQWTKQIASHFGGMQNSMAMSWPARIKDKGSRISVTFLLESAYFFPLQMVLSSPS
jgi:arylsulfatase A-like enzyme